MFITFEGPDGSGKSTQSKLLAETLGAHWQCFPDRRTPIGILIDAHLKRGWSVVHTNDGSEYLGTDSLKTDALAFQALQLANRVEVMPGLVATLRSGKHVVCDRYWGSGYAYGKADGLDPGYLLKIHEYLPEPALNILIDVPIEVAVERLSKRSGKVERYEGNVEFMKTIAENYRELWARHSNNKSWAVVDGSGSLAETQAKIQALLPKGVLNRG